MEPERFAAFPEREKNSHFSMVLGRIPYARGKSTYCGEFVAGGPGGS